MSGLRAAAGLAAWLLASCAAGPPKPDPTWLDDPLYARHERAVADFQRTRDHGVGDPAWRCDDLCRASDEACQTAGALCTQAGPGRRCDDARRGCSWTHTLLPRACAYCAPPPATPP